jgi:hypothetical protein
LGKVGTEQEGEVDVGGTGEGEVRSDVRAEDEQERAGAVGYVAEQGGFVYQDVL